VPQIQKVTEALGRQLNISLCLMHIHRVLINLWRYSWNID